MVVARGAKVETMGVMAELPPDLSPFQMGTRGTWKGTGFELVGRVRVAWQDGSWNEWCALFGDGRIGWLGEAQGLLMMSFPNEADAIDPASSKHYTVGSWVELDGRRWTVTDIKKAVCLAGEGELPFVAEPNRARTSLDLEVVGGTVAAFASIEFYDEGPQLFVGEYVRFGDLHFTELRAVPGWNGEVAQEKNQTTAMPCPQCGAPVNLRAAGLTMSAVCGSCGSLLDTANPQLRIIEEAHAAQSRIRYVIPLGQRGWLRGVEWEAIGVCTRADAYSEWSEYLLFNPWNGFAWLVRYQGHWCFVDRLAGLGANLPTAPGGQSVYLEGVDYQLFAQGTATVKTVLGEFYWRVRCGERAVVSDFVAPPYILSKEAYPDLHEVTWSRGIYVAHTEVAAAFQLKDLHPPTGPYLNQPNPYAEKWETLKWPFAVALIAVVVFQFIFAALEEERRLTDFELVYARSTPGAADPPASPGILFSGAGPSAPPASTPPTNPEPAIVQVTPHFQIDGHTSRVDVEGFADVDNKWIGADLDLVNVATGEHFSSEMEISYYHGYDDGDWSEGGKTERATFPAVPPGEYYLTADMEADPGLAMMPVKLKILRGGLYWSNFWIVLGLVLIYPMWVFWRRSSFERTRWSESDYNPYASKEE